MADTQRRAFFAGSFNPFTRGHMSIVQRACRIFDHVIIGIGINAAKTPPSDAEERAAHIRSYFADDERVSVVVFDDLTVEAARRHGANALVRGARTATDFDYERSMADVNRDISGLDTVILPALPEEVSISSSTLRDLASHGYDISRFLP